MTDVRDLETQGFGIDGGPSTLSLPAEKGVSRRRGAPALFRRQPPGVTKSRDTVAAASEEAYLPVEGDKYPIRVRAVLILGLMVLAWILVFAFGLALLWFFRHLASR